MKKTWVALAVLVTLAFACLPVTTHADTLTLDGASVDSVSFNTTLKTFSVQMGAADALPYQLDLVLGTKIPVLTLDEFAIVDGIPVEDEIQFLADFVDSWQYKTGSDMLTSDVTFRYGEAKVTEISGGGTPAPEPSSVALLVPGLLGLIGVGRKKRRS